MELVWSFARKKFTRRSDFSLILLLALEEPLINKRVRAGLFLLAVPLLIQASASVYSAARSGRVSQSLNERTVEDKIPKHVPIRIKLNAKAEKAFKDIDNPKWLGDFELQVTNTSDKPIYFLEIWLILPDFINGDGRPDGFTLRRGRMEFIYFDTLATPADTPIQSGETYTLKIPNDERRGWEQHKVRDNVPNPMKVQIVFVQLSFGDGSGFNGTDAKPYPYKRN